MAVVTQSGPADVSRGGHTGWKTECASYPVEGDVTDRGAAGLYSAMLVPAVGAAVALSAWVMDLSTNHAPGMPSGLDGWALNLVPAFAAGLLIYSVLAHFVHARLTGTHSLGRHIRRCAALYLVAFGLGALLLHDGRSPDFWSLGQIVLWPWLVAVAGLVADGMTALVKRREKIEQKGR